jgi:sugar lactone lactonase YvrE
MKTNKSLPKPLMLVAAAMVWCGLNLHAQPVIITQPASQTNLPGTTVSFSVGVTGTGPFSYQWQFNGTNFPNNIISTVAGNGVRGYAGNGGAATNAKLWNPEGVAFDASGNLFIADFFNNRIRKVNTNGIITTVAGGNNVSGSFGGDGGAATNASIFYPSCLAFDAYGNLFIADNGNDRIRKVDTNGIITTVAGNRYGSFGGDGGVATNASLALPQGVALDTYSNLFIADTFNNRIRKVDTNGIITTVAGNGSPGYFGDGGAATNAGLYHPQGVTFDAYGNLFIADCSNNRIRKVDANGIITTVAGNGSATYYGDGSVATNASIYAPYGVAFDAFGNLFIADTGNNRVRRMDTNGIITTVAGTNSAAYAGDGGAATNASLYTPIGVTFDASGNLFIADSGNNRIRKILLYAGYSTFTLNNISAINAGNYTVVITSSEGSVTSAVATLTVATPAVITIQPTNQLVVAGSNPSLSVAAVGSGPFDYEWYFGGTNLVQSGPNSTFTLPGASPNNTGNYTVVITNNYGSVTSQVATLTIVPFLITVQPASQLVVVGSNPSFSVAVAGSEPFGYELYFGATNLVQSGTNSTLILPDVSTNNAGNYTVVITNNYGSVTSQVATLLVLTPIQPSNLTNLAGTSVTFSAGVNETRPFSYQWQLNGTNLPNNIITTVAGIGPSGAAHGSYSGDGGAATNAGINTPVGVTFDTYGNLIFADFNNSRIRKVDTNGIITTVAGNGSFSYSGDNSAATNASLNYPQGVAFDAYGNLFIADYYNSRIRKVDTNGIITTVAGNGGLGYSGDGGAATNASLFWPQGVALDGFGNLFIADYNNQRIRKVDTNGIITTVAGKSGSGYSGDGGAATNASLLHPEGVAFDVSGNLFIADSGDNRIRKVDTNGIITTVAGGGTGGGTDGFGDSGTATNAIVMGPAGVAFDGSGNLFIGESINNRVREVNFVGHPTLTLNNITVTNAGNYSVVITSPYGSVTSLVASLTVIVPPQIIANGTNFGFTTNLANQFGFGFNLNGTSNQTIVVDGSTNLLDWTPLYTNLANGIPAYFFDPASTNFPGRFYRLRLP